MKSTSFKLSGQKGFSLVELLVVIAVIAIIAAIAIPNIANITSAATISKNQRNAQNIASVASAAIAAGYTPTWGSSEAAYDDLVDGGPDNGDGVQVGTMKFGISPMSGTEVTEFQTYIDFTAHQGTVGESSYRPPTLSYNPGS
jgi:prepilin-type N-terminal cleavage/methylation domain-containing protein